MTYKITQLRVVPFTYNDEEMRATCKSVIESGGKLWCDNISERDEWKIQKR